MKRIIYYLAILVGAMCAGCASAPTPTEQVTLAYDGYTAGLTALTGVENSHPFPQATALKIEADRDKLKTALDTAAAAITSGASASTISGDITILEAALGVFVTDQTTFANPFPVQATTQPTVTP